MPLLAILTILIISKVGNFTILISQFAYFANLY